MNPFDDDDISFRVLSNAEGQFSLWPATLDVPAGWAVRHGPAEKAACLEFITVHWTDMRPRRAAASPPDAA
ncbi:MbtH family protein [Actinomadura opuntiae]|uniref:MbtH family protein n=1 Tax=Actinomadura sp. OS1-43 TaxID=604315 RepID=UPI00255AEADE|nr:MbtH family NRPS accessory protein [Actinomadura sp. OS1-43]MDL4820264.1 MbtH family NRPS accessory protein [Actinomadura sp. OS1-43]